MYKFKKFRMMCHSTNGIPSAHDQRAKASEKTLLYERENTICVRETENDFHLS